MSASDPHASRRGEALWNQSPPGGSLSDELPPARGLPERSPQAAPLQDRLLQAPQLAAHLLGGGAALLPTDTLPALAVTPDQAGQIWERKRRPADKPLILMGADLAQLQALLAVPWAEAWLQQARRHWPGAVTLVLPIRGPITERLHPGGASLGLRVPACPLTQELLRLSGPLATSSANRSGLPAALDAAEAARQFPELPLLAPLPWPVASGQASSVWEWQGERHPSSPWRVLRPGAVTPAASWGAAATTAASRAEGPDAVPVSHKDPEPEAMASGTDPAGSTASGTALADAAPGVKAAPGMTAFGSADTGAAALGASESTATAVEITTSSERMV